LDQEKLKAMAAELTQNGIAWEEPTAPAPIPAPTESAPAQTHFTTGDKIALFRRLFRGRADVYPQRWESAKGTSGYSPACGNEWKPMIGWDSPIAPLRRTARRCSAIMISGITASQPQ
jgi:hypothetical protein